MNICIDDNLAEQTLANLLQKAGHTAVRPVDANLTGASDPRHWEYAITKQLVILTRDRVDFRELHQLILASGGTHPGLLVVRYDNDPTRDMRPKHIVTAIGKLERSGVSVAGDVVVLNGWR